MRGWRLLFNVDFFFIENRFEEFRQQIVEMLFIVVVTNLSSIECKLISTAVVLISDCLFSVMMDCYCFFKLKCSGKMKKSAKIAFFLWLSDHFSHFPSNSLKTHLNHPTPSQTADVDIVVVDHSRHLLAVK